MTDPHPSDPGYRLEVRQDADPSAALLAVELDGRGFPHGPGLAWLGGDYRRECWFGDGQLGIVALAEPDEPHADAAIAAERLYRRLIEQLADSRYPYPLRLWNYFPAINLGDGDEERYRRFCIGRGRALDRAGLSDAQMCAATAIGTAADAGGSVGMQVVALVGARPGVSIENPRQVSAWNYPKQYGPRQPAFARATGIRLDQERAGLLVSGTASVVGHVTAHPHDVLAQTEEAASNLEALLEHAAGAMRRPALAQFGAASLARVYVRRPEDWPRIEPLLRARWPQLKLCALQGDVCRDDLMVEIEAWHCA